MVLQTDNDAILAYLRTSADETVLCVANLASTPRSAVLRLPDHAGHHVTDVFGGARFPDVGPRGEVLVTLGSRDFFWLTVTSSEAG